MSSLSSDETTSAALFEASRRILYPFLQILCYGSLILMLASAILFSLADAGSASLHPTVATLMVIAIKAQSVGLLPFTILTSFAALLFFRFWEKILVFLLLVTIAWLTKA
ncbi:MAG: hypothetical protein WCV84_00995 [Patescibacteria group bacterium]